MMTLLRPVLMLTAHLKMMEVQMLWSHWLIQVFARDPPR